MANPDSNERRLRNATSWQLKSCSMASPIGLTVRQYLQDRGGMFKKNKIVIDTWNEIVPAEMCSHCMLVGIETGILTVEVDPGPYMHEMRLMSNELLRYLQSHCSRSGVRKIVLRARSQRIEDNPEEQV
ncbi:MAG: DUF721 domain-containing protein [Sedimentisphaerales bacterium]|nr:DUF721 domain-containing protein [Sedimentisphaerales bacterium]